MQVTSGNYASVAKTDDVGDTNPRATRIALAVERSRTEYQPQHAYTERGTADATSFYCSGRHREALDLILETADFDKPMAGLSREMVDTGTRAALACGDVERGVKLAQAGSQHWRAPFVGLAESASDAFVAGQQPLAVSVRPLLLAGPHPPILSRLTTMLSSRTSPQVRAFHSLLLGNDSPIDVEALAAELGSDVEPLRIIIRRLQRGTEDGTEKSVRDL